jgi:hypothetical protein
VPGKPKESLLLRAIEYGGDFYDMPPQGKLPENVIADFRRWIEIGAPDPRTLQSNARRAAAKDWESLFQERMRWWSLQPLAKVSVPGSQNDAWCRTGIDRFIAAAMDANRLVPNPAAERRVLARRIAFALTGLPPDPSDVDSVVADPAPDALEKYVDALLDRPQFGEHWARHWMDVVHYSDTHGYEWDIPIKGAWRYRDYLIRAFNSDVSYCQLVLEHLAGDLLADDARRVAAGRNESLLGTASLFLGERRHGDSSQFAGITEEGMDNVIDTVGKAFLATTVACSRCHDHKLDAIPQKDYYALFGIFMSSRWNARSVNAEDPNQSLYPQMESLKSQMRGELANAWRQSLANAFELPAETNLDVVKAESAIKPRDETAKKTEPAKKADTPPKPESFLYLLQTLRQGENEGKPAAEVWQTLAAKYQQLRRERVEANASQKKLVADFSRGQIPDDWQVDGLGARAGLISTGDFAVAESGDTAVRRLLPPGLHTDRYSTRLQGAIRTPLIAGEHASRSFEIAAGGATVQRTIIANAWNPEGTDYVDSATRIWKSTTPRDYTKRKVYVELCTTGLNATYPPRVDLVDAASKANPQAALRSWFGVSRVVSHATPQQLPQDELLRYERLFASEAPESYSQVTGRLRAWARAAADRFAERKADDEDILLLDGLLQGRVLTNRADLSPELARLVKEYRQLETRITPDETVSALADYREATDERLAIRGSYTEFSDAVPRGTLRMLDVVRVAVPSAHSGRLELAESIASPHNPLTARVYVNRVWHFLFGAGLVRTTDDFGHLGERPSHPELLDWLSARFIDEGWSTKKLIRAIIHSATWQQTSTPRAEAIAIDPENRFWHHLPLRRLEAEAVRDAMLVASGRYNSALYGPPIDPYRTAEDSQKRLFRGPIDGAGRRSLYLKMTLMEPPKLLALFNQPIPKVTVGRRDMTNVPDQALALLNDPQVLDAARRWANSLLHDGAKSPDERLNGMFRVAFGRSPRENETARFLQLIQSTAELRKVPPAQTMTSVPIWQDVAHALFNVKEFIYVP